MVLNGGSGDTGMPAGLGIGFLIEAGTGDHGVKAPDRLIGDEKVRGK